VAASSEQEINVTPPRRHLTLRIAACRKTAPDDVPISPALRHLMTDPAASALKFDHAQVTGRFYYALPRQLVILLESELGSGTFDPAAWDLERRLAAETDRHWNRVGYRDGFPLDYPYLFEPVGMEIPNDARTAAGMSTGQAATLIATWAGAAPRFHGPTVGYCGWLLTNPDFLAEHDALLDRWLGHLFHHPIPGPADIQRLVFPANGELPVAPSPAAFVADFAGFYDRWRLTGLAAPYLPCPAVPQIPAPVPARNRPPTGMTFFLPDTFPVPSREELRNLLEGALRGGEPPAHLAEWRDLVRGDKRSKNAIARYGRLFLLQHLMAVLFFRHGPALRRKHGRVEQALARYLLGDRTGGEETVHKDVGFIRDRLGPDWCPGRNAAPMK
jgi:hypothetical protein